MVNIPETNFEQRFHSVLLVPYVHACVKMGTAAMLVNAEHFHLTQYPVVPFTVSVAQLAGGMKETYFVPVPSGSIPLVPSLADPNVGNVAQELFPRLYSKTVVITAELAAVDTLTSI